MTSPSSVTMVLSVCVSRHSASARSRSSTTSTSPSRYAATSSYCAVVADQLQHRPAHAVALRPAAAIASSAIGGNAAAIDAADVDAAAARAS